VVADNEFDPMLVFLITTYMLDKKDFCTLIPSKHISLYH